MDYTQQARSEESNKMPKKYEGKVVEDPDTGEQILTFTDDLMEHLGWKEGDELDFQQDKQGNITIKNLTKEDE